VTYLTKHIKVEVIISKILVRQVLPEFPLDHVIQATTDIEEVPDTTEEKDIYSKRTSIKKKYKQNNIYQRINEKSTSTFTKVLWIAYQRYYSRSLSDMQKKTPLTNYYYVIKLNFFFVLHNRCETMWIAYQCTNMSRTFLHMYLTYRSEVPVLWYMATSTVPVDRVLCTIVFQMSQYLIIMDELRHFLNFMMFCLL